MSSVKAMTLHQRLGYANGHMSVIGITELASGIGNSPNLLFSDHTIALSGGADSISYG
jgi:hypothetical protein